MYHRVVGSGIITPAIALLYSYWDVQGETYADGRTSDLGPVRQITAGGGSTFTGDAANAGGWLLDAAGDELQIEGYSMVFGQSPLQSGRYATFTYYNDDSLFVLTGTTTKLNFDGTDFPGSIDVSGMTGDAVLLTTTNCDLDGLVVGTNSWQFEWNCYLNSAENFTQDVDLSGLSKITSLVVFDVDMSEIKMPTSLSDLGVADGCSLIISRAVNTTGLRVPTDFGDLGDFVVNISYDENGYDTAAVDQILSDCVDSLYEGGTLDVRDNSAPSNPTGDGYVTTLEGRDWDVFTD